MSEDIAESGQARFQVKPTSDSHFSWLRTRLAVESTLMSWVRTSISLIGFGFTIVQFFATPVSSGPTSPPLRRPPSV